MSSRIIGRLPQTEGQAAHKKYLLDIAIRIFQEALDAPQGTHMTHRASIFPFAGALILQCSDRRDLVLRLALRMAGRPDKQYVPTFIRSAGNQLLAMLWYAFAHSNACAYQDSHCVSARRTILISNAVRIMISLGHGRSQ